MKKGIHPQYNEIKVTLVSGEVIKVYSTSKKDIVLDTDPTNHPAWTGQRKVAERGQRATQFKKKFDGFKL
ncbi:MAG: 50S ribosomal protein L31 [Alphaproteobacteria bacterium]|nr:50S ribosomal protein L31 [Alphaproteobacteria bacterium]